MRCYSGDHLFCSLPLQLVSCHATSYLVVSLLWIRAAFLLALEATVATSSHCLMLPTTAQSLWLFLLMPLVLTAGFVDSAAACPMAIRSLLVAAPLLAVIVSRALSADVSV
jgi:hypothetical protein